jgi:hypothetical protein
MGITAAGREERRRTAHPAPKHRLTAIPKEAGMWAVYHAVLGFKSRYIGEGNTQGDGEQLAEKHYESLLGGPPLGGFVWERTETQSVLRPSEHETYTVTALQAISNEVPDLKRSRRII